MPLSPSSSDRRRGALLVEVERHDARAGRGQRLDDRAADAARRAGDQRHLALQLAGRRGERELVELQRPVLDREALRLVERHEAAERVGAGHDLDRPVVEVARQPRRLDGGRHADEPDVLDQHDPRVGIGRDGRVVAVAVDVRAVVVAERAGALADALGQRVRVLGRRVERDPQRQPLGVHEMVGAGGADRDELGRRPRRDELDRSRRRVDHEHLRPLARRPRRAARAGPRQHRRGRSPPSPAGPSNRCAPVVRALTNSTAWLMTSIVRR